MSDPVEDTRGQTSEDRRGLAPRPKFAPGETVPGLSSWVLERKLGGVGSAKFGLPGTLWVRKSHAR